LPQPRLLISRSALANNLKLLIKKSGELKAFPVLKANAYGVGYKEVAEVFEKFSEDKVPYFCLARLNEAHEARALGTKRNLLLLSDWPNDFSKLPKNTDTTVASFEDLEKLSKYSKPIRFHIKLNTGMNRMGMRLTQIFEAPATKDKFLKILELIKRKKHILMGIHSQLATADASTTDFAEEQLTEFELDVTAIQEIWGKRIPFIHFANSRGIIKSIGKNSKSINSFRPGIHLWGVRDPDSIVDLSPVITLRVPVRQLYWIEKGESVGYGRSFVAPQRMKVATLNLGYADGMRRGSGRNNLKFFMGDRALSIIGNESMDLCSVDCTEVEDIKVGTELEWIGPHQSLEKIAETWGTLPYEVLTSISPRVVRILK
jgi:alanine racemase